MSSSRSIRNVSLYLLIKPALGCAVNTLIIALTMVNRCSQKTPKLPHPFFLFHSKHFSSILDSPLVFSTFTAFCNRNSCLRILRQDLIRLWGCVENYRSPFTVYPVAPCQSRRCYRQQCHPTVTGPKLSLVILTPISL